MAFLEAIERVSASFSSVFAPPPDLTVSQWADEFLFLSPEDSAEPGKYRSERAPYQRGMLDAVSDPSVKEVVFCTSSQVGKTLLAKAVIGYHIHQDPGPILLMQPTTSMAETFSKDRLSPMVRDTPALRSLIADPKSRTSGNTIDKKSFPGGHITMIGANAPTELASRPIRIVLADEVDRYPVSAGSEGDPLFLARQRSVTFWNRKLIVTSTPTIAGASRIWTAFERSDQRRYYLPCPHCGEFHLLKWPQMAWDEGDPTSARMACPVCGGLYTDSDKMRMLALGEWRANAPFNGIAGFHISALYSPWQTFADVVREWIDKKDHPETLKTFINLQLGECWEDREGEKVEWAVLAGRRESWQAIPEDVVLLTAGADTQDDRLEISIVGWTATKQARVVRHSVLWGSPGENQVWNELDDILLDHYETEDGRLLRIRAATVDSGGHFTQRVYEFTRDKLRRKVVATKGRDGTHPIWPKKASRTKLSKGTAFFMVGADTAKDWIRSALTVSDPALPHYVAFSSDLPDEYFKGLVSERRVTMFDKLGRPKRAWKKPQGVRNEPLDCFVGNVAALALLEESGVKLRTINRASQPRIAKEQPAHIPVLSQPQQLFIPE